MSWRNRLFQLRKLISIVGNSGLLIRRNDEDFDSAVLGADLGLFCYCNLVCRLVKLDAYLSEVATYLATQKDGVLSYSTCEDHSVNHT